MSQPFDQSDLARRRRQMVELQMEARGISDPAVLAAMRQVPREEFVPQDVRAHAFDDSALPIGEGQTISQPYMVAYMTEQLRLTHDCRVLEVGTGSGYQCAVLAHLARRVFTIERIAGLQSAAMERLARLGSTNVEARAGDGSVGWPDEAPFDRIIVTAGAPHVPQPLIDQLVDGGILIAPVGGMDEQRVVRVTRQGGSVSAIALLACRFVKLLGREGWTA